MVLSDRNIKRYITAGKIKIRPELAYETQLGSCSVVTCPPTPEPFEMRVL